MRFWRVSESHLVHLLCSRQGCAEIIPERRKKKVPSPFPELRYSLDLGWNKRHFSMFYINFTNLNSRKTFNTGHWPWRAVILISRVSVWAGSDLLHVGWFAKSGERQMQRRKNPPSPSQTTSRKSSCIPIFFVLHVKKMRVCQSSEVTSLWPPRVPGRGGEKDLILSPMSHPQQHTGVPSVLSLKTDNSIC